MTGDEARAAVLAARLDELNRDRQEMTRAAETLAREITGEGDGRALSFVGHGDFHQGVVGLVASRLVDAFGRPAVVFQMGETHSRGSCRSIPEYDIVSGLRACGDLFDRYGGHKQAGGFTVSNDRLSELEERIVAHAAGALRGVTLGPVIDIDVEVPLCSIRGSEIQWLKKLEPHGMANPDPTLLSRGVTRRRCLDGRPGRTAFAAEAQRRGGDVVRNPLRLGVRAAAGGFAGRRGLQLLDRPLRGHGRRLAHNAVDADGPGDCRVAGGLSEPHRPATAEVLLAGPGPRSTVVKAKTGAPLMRVRSRMEWTVAGLRPDLRRWEDIYNTIRPHQALSYLTPQEYITQWRLQGAGKEVVQRIYWTSTARCR